MMQTDLLESDVEAGSFAGNPAPGIYRADLEEVRAKLSRIIAEVREAAVMPWSDEDLRLYRRVVPRVSLWLPDDEAARVRSVFEAEIRRLEAV